MYACLSHLFLYNGICCSIYVLNIMVEMMMVFMGLRPKMIELWLSYEMWDLRSVYNLYIDNLGPPGIGETTEISIEISVDFIWKLY
jgi:hypothetical protein